LIRHLRSKEVKTIEGLDFTVIFTARVKIAAAKRDGYN
jgi:hypothetical protein